MFQLPANIPWYTVTIAAKEVYMSFDTAKTILLVATIIWIISLLIPYSRLGITKRGDFAIRVIMSSILIGALITYTIFTT